jgi:uncharacterized membrane protein
MAPFNSIKFLTVSIHPWNFKGHYKYIFAHSKYAIYISVMNYIVITFLMLLIIADFWFKKKISINQLVVALFIICMILTPLAKIIKMKIYGIEFNCLVDTKKTGKK